MIKKLVLFIIAIAVVGCSSSQPVVRTKNPVYRKPNSSVASRTNTKKPTYKTGTNKTATVNKPTTS
ncbi:MAG TPA: hypothetical protein VK528_10725, partial [Flavobacterium sp.]|nr:hypothetical protein [Flavobacterium sp.]